jgi:hypothetical protein
MERTGLGPTMARIGAVCVIGLMLGSCGSATTPTRHPTITTPPIGPTLPLLPITAATATPSPSPSPSPSPIATTRVTAAPSVRPAPAPRAPAAPAGKPHILVVMDENLGYSGTLGACSADPYLCSLASSYASASNWYGVTHPSQPNYEAIDSGSTQGCTSDNCVGAGNYSTEDLGGQLTSAGIPWVAWMESMPSPCYTGQGAAGGSYVLKHNPFVTFRDNLTGACHIQPYPGSTGAVSVLDGANAPDFVWITPNICDDMHDSCGPGNAQQGDAWLKSNLPGILASSWFRDFPSTVIVTLDEGDGNPNGAGSAMQGGHIPLVIISSNAQGKGNIAASGDHYGLLRSIEEVLSLPLLGGAADPSNGDLRALFG